MLLLNLSRKIQIECRGDCMFIKHFDHTTEGEYRSEGTTNEQNGVNLSKKIQPHLICLTPLRFKILRAFLLQSLH